MHEQRAGPNQAIEHRADHGRVGESSDESHVYGMATPAIQADAHSTIHPFREATKLWRSERLTPV